jgi:hypothetical protein
MPHAPTPWIGLAALVAMFVLPFLPSWIFEGPRTVKHWPRRHVCGECGAPWTDDHTCPLPAAATAAAAARPLRAQLRRRPAAAIEGRRGRPARRALPRR